LTLSRQILGPYASIAHWDTAILEVPASGRGDSGVLKRNLIAMLADTEMEPTLLPVHAIMSPLRAAHFERWLQEFR